MKKKCIKMDKWNWTLSDSNENYLWKRRWKKNPKRWRNEYWENRVTKNIIFFERKKNLFIIHTTFDYSSKEEQCTTNFCSCIPFFFLYFTRRHWRFFSLNNNLQRVEKDLTKPRTRRWNSFSTGWPTEEWRNTQQKN